MPTYSFDLDAAAELAAEEDTDGQYLLNENHAAEAISHLIELFRNGPRNQSLLESVLSQSQELEDMLWALYYAFMVDTATGDQLDVLGRVVGETRQGRGDEDYRSAVRVRILVNSSSGTVPEMYAIAEGMVPSATVRVQEVAPMTLSIQFDTLGSSSLRTVFTMLRQAKQGGVRLLVTYGGSVGAVDGDPLGGIIGAVDGNPLGFIVGGGT